MTTHASMPLTGAKTMTAIVQDSYGSEPAAVLRVATVARPTAGDDDVLVRVEAASVDMGTWHCMTGMPYAMRLVGFGLRRPKASNPGRALAGSVESVGRNVTAFAPGDDVYGTCDGSLAEYALVPSKQLAAKPGNVTFEHAASAPISGVTALQAVRKASVQPAHKVLVVGASGGVGSFAVQIAKAAGAEVTGVCSATKVDLVRALGADHVIDYTTEDFVHSGVRFDVILDIGGARRLSQLRRVLTPTGALVIVGGETAGRWLGGFGRSIRAVLISPFLRQRLAMLASTENAEDLEALCTLIESGQVTPAVDRTFSLGETPEAIGHVRAGRARGKVVVRVQHAD